MLDLRTIQGRAGQIAEDFDAMVAEIEQLRGLVCDACSSDIPLHSDGYHIDGGKKIPCEANLYSVESPRGGR
ncbi:hypothetical protein LCGC14_0839600 [marine sediment metagenome]|uniref:DksA C4-type domain-containing protein n=1 Tax=marine sediment metagenome TaxID=412755 RepID=A0A0F9PYR7_9ZZZZ